MSYVAAAGRTYNALHLKILQWQGILILMAKFVTASTWQPVELAQIMNEVRCPYTH